MVADAPEPTKYDLFVTKALDVSELSSLRARTHNTTLSVCDYRGRIGANDGDVVLRIRLDNSRIRLATTDYIVAAVKSIGETILSEAERLAGIDLARAAAQAEVEAGKVLAIARLARAKEETS